MAQQESSRQPDQEGEQIASKRVSSAVKRRARDKKPLPVSLSTGDSTNDYAAAIDTYLVGLAMEIKEELHRGEQASAQLVPLTKGKRPRPWRYETRLCEVIPSDAGGGTPSPLMSPPAPQLLTDIVAQTRLVVVLGEPGAGKTSALGALVLEYISAYRKGTSSVLPVFIPLREYTNPRQPASEFLRAALIQRVGSPSHPLIANFSRLLQQGQILLVLDGLNELPSRNGLLPGGNRSQQAAATAALAQQFLQTEGSAERFQRWQLDTTQDPRETSLRYFASENSTIKMVFSCRNTDFCPSISWQQVHLLPLSDQQIATLTRVYLPRSYTRFMEALQTRVSLSVRNVAGNPFFLRALVFAFRRRRGWLPETRSALVELLATTFVKRSLLATSPPTLDNQSGEAATSRGKEVTRQQITELLDRLAYLSYRLIDTGFSAGTDEAQILAFLAAFEPDPAEPERALAQAEKAGLLIRSGIDNTLSFSHQLLEYYLAARAVSKQLIKTSGIALANELSRWAETFLFLYELANNPLDQVLRPLVGALQHNYASQTRRKAATTLATIADPLCIAPFIVSLHDDDTGVRLISAQALIGFGSQAVESLLPALGDHHQGTRWIVADILGKIKDTRAIGPLIQALQDEDYIVRSHVASALAELGEPAVLPLLRCLSDPKPRVRWRVSWALGELQDRRASDALLGLLYDSDPWVRMNAAQALGRLQIPEAIPPLIGCLGDEVEWVRTTVQDALLACDTLARPALRGALTHSVPLVRGGAAYVLGRLLDTTSAEQLLALSHSDSSQIVRQMAWSAFQNLVNAGV